MSSSLTPSSPPIPPQRFINTLASFDEGGVEDVWDVVRRPPRGLRSYLTPEAVRAQSNASAGMIVADSNNANVGRRILSGSMRSMKMKELEYR